MADLFVMVPPSVRGALLLLGSFAFGYNAATALHEFGHVLAAWATGGRVQAFYLHPFTTSYTTIDPDPSPLLTHAAGVTLAPLAGLVCIALARRVEGAYTVPLYATGVAAFATSGIYLVVGTWAGMGDARTLVDLGTPPLGLMLVGAGLIAAAVRLAPHVVSLLGLSPTDSLLRRLAVLELGVAPYLMGMLVWHVLYDPAGLRPWSVFVGTGIGLVGLIALFQRGTPLLPSQEASSTTARATVVALALGAGIVLAEFGWF